MGGGGARGVQEKGWEMLKECGQLCCLVGLFGVAEGIERPMLDCTVGIEVTSND